MLVLTLNAGSNSCRFDLIEIDRQAERPTAGTRRLSGAVENIGKADPFLTVGEERRDIEAASYFEAATLAFAALKEHFDRGLTPEIIAHRIVHGGDEFNHPIPTDDKAVAGITRWKDLAPLHNGPALEVVECARKELADTPAMAVFDSSFHSRLPPRAYTYALPASLSSELGIRRYGFHGISHRYQLLRYAELNGIRPDKAKLVTLHLEGGSSAAAIRDGHSIDTSMGFTPLEGLVMGSRCGDLDPAILPWLARKKNLDADGLDRLLNRESGLLGLSGISGDTRILMERPREPAAQLALEVFSYRVLKYTAAYLGALGGADAIVFSGGIGENTPIVRETVGEGLAWCGLELDPTRNEKVVEGDVCISRPSSRIAAWVLHSDEAMMLAWEAVQQLG